VAPAPAAVSVLAGMIAIVWVVAWLATKAFVMLRESVAWSWVWGLWGAILAVPMMAVVKAVCDHVEDLQGVGAKA
jgi:hypothetical protein